MKKSESIFDYFSRTLVIVSQMRANGKDVKDFQVMEKILQTLSTRFEYITTAIMELNDRNSLTVDELMGSLHAH